MGWLIAVGLVAALVGIAVYDLVQRRHAILRNFPLIGHLRFLLEGIGPELRQYIVTDNDSERPFSRDQRRWVYASAKQQNNAFAFGSDNDFERPVPGYILIKPAAFPRPPGPVDYDTACAVPAAKVLGGGHGRRHAVRPPSIVNISAMSYGSLSGAAVEALNRGAALAGAWQWTGEGGISSYHLHGGELVFQIGTGYFGVRTGEGLFDLARLVELCEQHPVRAIELKLSQGAKPGLGGLLPGPKVTREIALFRGVPQGVDCRSPRHHAEFSTVDQLIEFCERLAEATGLPVGIKSAVGETIFWEQLATRMAETGGGPDFITIDGGEGGTGAAPLVYADHVALPFRVAFPRVYRTFAEAGLREQVFFFGAGKLGFPETALLALALGCDGINVGRTAMLSIGCVQAQRCHTGHCPTGVATQSKWLSRGLDPTSKSARAATYLRTLRHELLVLAATCGRAHPSLVDLSQIELLSPSGESRSALDVYGYEPGWGLPGPDDALALCRWAETPPAPVEAAVDLRT